MMNIIIKTDERRAAEAQALREYGIDPNKSTAEQREYAERIAYDCKIAAGEFDHMEGKNNERKV